MIFTIHRLFGRVPSLSDLLWASFAMKTYWHGSLLNSDGGKDIFIKYGEFEVMASRTAARLLEEDAE
jgi:hypothetical protein